MGALSPMHLLLILGIAVLILGPKRLPEAGEALGRALREFRDAVGGDEASTTGSMASTASMTPPSAATMAAPAPATAPPVADGSEGTPPEM